MRSRIGVLVIGWVMAGCGMASSGTAGMLPWGVNTGYGSDAAGPRQADPSPRAPEAVQAALADLYGTIDRVDVSGRRILVVGAGNSAWLTVNDRTRILRLTDTGHDTADFGGLHTGAQVTVTFAGPIRESYPLQGQAGQVIIVQ